jgi:hypothetical protein
MSNNYASFYVTPSAVQSDNYVYAQTIGPLNSSQTPGQIPYHSKGVLHGVHPNPPQYYPSDGASEFAQARFQYANVDTSKKQQMIARDRVLAASHPHRFFSLSTQRQLPVSNSHMNYIAPTPSSMYTSVRKRQAVGKSSFKQGLGPNAALSYKVPDRNDVKTALRVVRGGGCIAPKKCGAVYSTTCRAGGGVCNVGAFSGQGY